MSQLVTPFYVESYSRLFFLPEWVIHDALFENIVFRHGLQDSTTNDYYPPTYFSQSY